jgi:hypothetical protein
MSEFGTPRPLRNASTTGVKLDARCAVSQPMLKVFADTCGRAQGPVAAIPNVDAQNVRLFMRPLDQRLRSRTYQARACYQSQDCQGDWAQRTLLSLTTPRRGSSTSSFGAAVLLHLLARLLAGQLGVKATPNPLLPRLRAHSDPTKWESGQNWRDQ